MNHYTRWLELKEENPGKYARDIAGLMNISEAELTFARVGHDAGACAVTSARSWPRWKRWAKPNASAATTTPFTSRSAPLPINT